ncbi:hypothetical protein Ddc_19390 [Ditylenchus destructor]|nr:hypothetical protein Ddc_19390 [Ditylenchus destructor]
MQAARRVARSRRAACRRVARRLRGGRRCRRASRRAAGGAADRSTGAGRGPALHRAVHVGRAAGGAIARAGAELVIVPMPDDPPWHAIQVLVGLIRSRDVDVLHAHLPGAHRLAGLAGRITGVPVLCTVQGQQIDMPDLEVHRMIGSQLSVVSEASYFHALGLGIAPERLGCDAFDAEADSAVQSASLQAIGQRLVGIAVAAAVAPAADPMGEAPSRGLAQAARWFNPCSRNNPCSRCSRCSRSDRHGDCRESSPSNHSSGEMS